MPSSPDRPVVVSVVAEPESVRLVQLLSQVGDPRARRGVRHRLAGVLAVGIAATAAGARSFVAIAEWAADLGIEQLSQLGLKGRRPPSEATIRRVCTAVDADALDVVLGAFFRTRTARVRGRRVIAVDGKAVRGARTPEADAPHLVAALDHATGTVLGQVQVDAKTNEIPAARALLSLFDLTGTVVTLDAMHTQTDTATMIVKAEGDYVLTVKNNQCATRRSVTSPPQAGQTRREVCWV